METPPIAPAPLEPKKSNTPIIVAIVAVVLVCCCCLALGLLWQFGDALMNSFQF
ncbi:MAG TPA: hypothetical protein VJ785_08685 [Anaerolineales bacterium]|nr:hypothetical protein [Anaerolineales bacterium]